MEFQKSSIPEVIICTPKVYEDDRGFLSESYRKDKLDNFISHPVNFCQDITTYSKKNVFRGLHFQKPPFSQSKLVKVLKGKVIDFAVDLRVNSETFLQHVSIELSDKNHKQLFIPRGFAHGFLSLEDSIFSYKVDNFYSIDHDMGISVFDSKLNIDLKNYKDIIVSDKDNSLPNILDINNHFKYSEDLYEK